MASRLIGVRMAGCRSLWEAEQLTAGMAQAMPLEPGLEQLPHDLASVELPPLALLGLPGIRNGHARLLESIRQRSR
jgi:hypothetical protein